MGRRLNAYDVVFRCSALPYVVDLTANAEDIVKQLAFPSLKENCVVKNHLCF